MAKLISVKNNQVVVTDIETGEIKVVPYISELTKDYVAAHHTKVGATLGVTLIRQAYQDKEALIEFYNTAGDELGCSLAKFTSMLHGASYRAYIKDNEVLHNRFGLLRGTGRLSRDSYVVKLVNYNIDILKEYISDGNAHMAGYGLTLGNASTAKEMLGKGLWKQLCRNSLSRNDLICKILVYTSLTTKDLRRGNGLSIKGLVMFLNKIPSTLFKRFSAQDIMTTYLVSKHTCTPDLIGKVVKYLNKPLCRIDDREIMRYNDIISDTFRMIPTDYNPEWSIKRIIKEHKDAAGRALLSKASTKIFSSVDILPNIYSHGDFTASICKSAYDMVLLGIQENHCIGTYSRYVEHGHYIAYLITDTNGLASSIGIKNPNSTLYLPNQHYHSYNAHVEDGARLSFGKDLIKLVSEIMKKSIKVSSPYDHVEPVINEEIPF